MHKVIDLVHHGKVREADVERALSAILDGWPGDRFPISGEWAIDVEALRRPDSTASVAIADKELAGRSRLVRNAIHNSDAIKVF